MISLSQNIITDKLLELKGLLNTSSKKFSNYQTFPKSFKKKYNNFFSNSYEVNQLDLDYERYLFLTQNIKLQDLEIVEYGSNLGYFCLSLAQNFKSKIIGYEPLKEYCKCSKIISQLMGVEKKVKFYNKTININDIYKLDKADLLIELNVLHHAGSIFDKNRVKENTNWEEYALERLTIIRKKYKKFFFQTGNMLNQKALFPSETSAKYIYKLLKKTGWKVKSIGMIDNLSSHKLKFNKYLPTQIENIPQYKCRRVLNLNKVSYENTVSKKKNLLLTGLANRPLWICE